MKRTGRPFQRSGYRKYPLRDPAIAAEERGTNRQESRFGRHRRPEGPSAMDGASHTPKGQGRLGRAFFGSFFTRVKLSISKQELAQQGETFAKDFPKNSDEAKTCEILTSPCGLLRMTISEDTPALPPAQFPQTAVMPGRRCGGWQTPCAGGCRGWSRWPPAAPPNRRYPGGRGQYGRG